MVKSAWIEMAGVPNADAYHKRTAWVRPPAGGACVPIEVGLVGLHIVKKTPLRPQWIWSTFEHVDTVPDDGPDRPLIYNNRSGVAMSSANPYRDPEDVVQEPTNIDRVKPIAAETAQTNARYWQALPANSLWRNYRLVMTQWPRSVGRPDLGGGAGNSVPGTGMDRTAFANVTMEPFEQRAVATSGCMACHNRHRPDTDYVFSVFDRPLDRDTSHLVAPAISSPEALRQLRELKRTVEHANRSAAQNR